MEFPYYLLDSAKRSQYFQALEKVPSVIAQTAEHEGVRIRDYHLAVRGYAPGGMQLSLDHFSLDKR